MTDRYLTIYLRDHLAMARAGIDFVQRVADANERNVIGARLDEFTTRLDEEAEALVRAMDLLGVEPSQLKMAGARIAEKMGRLKLNGEIGRYSPLSRLLEIEALTAAVQMRKGLWRTMDDARQVYPELDELPIDRYRLRAGEQLELLETMHRKAARAMLEGGRKREDSNRRRPRQ